jgi:hypothetical protein
MMNWFDKQDIVEVVKEIKNLQQRITEESEYIIWYNDTTLIENFSPSQETYDDYRKELPELRLKMVELENKLDKVIEEKIELYEG